jgi:PAS domain S-box-containing protein
MDLRQQYERLLDSLPDGVMGFGVDGVVAWMNPEARRLFQCDANHVAGSLIGSWLPKLDAAPDDNRPPGSRRKSLPRWHTEGRRVDASVFPVEVTITAVDDHDPSHAFIAVCRDTSTEHRLQAMQHEFVSMVSHELRTPLTSLRAALALIGDDEAALPPPSRRLLELAQQNGERLVRLVNDILDYEKLRVGSLRIDLGSHDLERMVHAAAQAIEHMAREARVRVQVQGSRDGAVPHSAFEAAVRTDARRFEQVLFNLMSNAIKHSPRDSVVHVTLRRWGERARVEVRDEGPGVDPAFVDRLFEPFAQANTPAARKQGGTGLGLAISRDLMHWMDGAIGLETPVAGRGAVFWCEVPLDQEPLSTFLAPLAGC